VKKKISFVVTVFVLIMLTGVTLFLVGRVHEDVRPIAIEGAMDIEISALLHEMGTYKTEKDGSYIYYIGNIDEIPVIVARTEVGMVNAAASTMLLIEKYHPKAIINQGTAGGHDPNLHVFDIVIGTKTVNIGKYRTEHRDAGKGSDPMSWIFEKTTLQENGQTNSYVSFSSDPTLVQAALQVGSTYTHGKVVEGMVGSADVWNREVDRIKWFHEKVGTSAEEMEAASAAQVAKAFATPYLSLRVISNSEVSGERTEDLKKAGQYGAEFAIQVVKAIDKNGQPARRVEAKIETKNIRYWIESLGLISHPEGGYYRETYHSKESISDQELSHSFAGKRMLATSIYFLLPSDQVSHFHRLKSDELWYYHAGSSLTIYVIHENGELQQIRLGPDLKNGEVLQAIIPKNSIFGSVVNEKDSYSLVGCMVSPGFDFQDFELFKRDQLLRMYPKHHEIITKLTEK
jgi:adenosylhomocysteine nucleosidase